MYGRINKETTNISFLSSHTNADELKRLTFAAIFELKRRSSELKSNHSLCKKSSTSIVTATFFVDRRVESTLLTVPILKK